MKLREILIGLGVLTLAACETAPDLAAPEPAPEILPAEAAPTAEEAAFADATRERLAAARYMEDECSQGSFPGWDGLPLIDCAYQVRNANGEARSGRAIMLNPSAEQLARWIFAACADIGRDDATCRQALFEWIVGQSGAQFVVAGVVLEDIGPEDGAFEAYTFRNGVTVKLRGIPNAATRQLNAGEIAAVLSTQTEVESSRRRARIASTSPDEYRANGGAEDVGTTAAPSLAWPTTVAALYRGAWDRRDNELITAWARANPGRLD